MHSATEYAIEISNLVKKFGSLTAVDNVNLKIKKGEIFGLLGPNGAGKSTTINMILGLMEPTSGKVLVNGVDVQKNPSQTKEKVGVVTQETVVEPELTARENLMIFGRLYHIPEAELDKSIDFALRLSDLVSFRDAYAGTFSGGMKRRLETAKALMHVPEVILLDEPTTGLDVQNRTKIWNLLKDINKRDRVTILMTTQYLEEADQMCDRIGIVDHGKLIALGTPEELRHKVGSGNVVEVTVEKESVQKAAQMFKRIGLEPQVSNNRVTASGGSRTAEKVEKLVKALSASKIAIHNISMHEPTLDDIFMKLTGSAVRDETGESSESGITRALMKGSRGG